MPLLPSSKNPSTKEAKSIVKENIKVGYLSKQSRMKFQVAAVWQKRFVEISAEDCILRYYKSQEDIEPVGQPVNIALVDSVLPAKEVTRRVVCL